MKKNNKQNRGNPAKVAVDGLVHTDEHNSDTGLVHIGVHNTLHTKVDGLVHTSEHNTVHINVYDLVHIGVRNTVHINDFAAQGAQQHFSVGVKTVGSNKKTQDGQMQRDNPEPTTISGGANMELQSNVLTQANWTN